MRSESVDINYGSFRVLKRLFTVPGETIPERLLFSLGNVSIRNIVRSPYAIAIALGVFLYYAMEWIPIQGLSMGWSILFLCLGMVAGRMLTMYLGRIATIRSKEESERLGLPRIPFTTRRSLVIPMLLSILLVTIVVILANNLDHPAASRWVWFFVLPIPIVIIFRSSKENVQMLRELAGFTDVTALHRAAQEIHGKSIVGTAAMAGDNQTMQRMLQAGADVDQFCQWGFTALLFSIIHHHESTALLLMASGADVNKSSMVGTTPLMAAAQAGSKVVVETLLSKEVKVNARQLIVGKGSGRTALMFAIAGSDGHAHYAEIVHLLLGHGADPTIRDAAGNTAVDLAKEAGFTEIVNVLEFYYALHEGTKKPADESPDPTMQTGTDRVRTEMWNRIRRLGILQLVFGVTSIVIVLPQIYHRPLNDLGMYAAIAVIVSPLWLAGFLWVWVRIALHDIYTSGTFEHEGMVIESSIGNRGVLTKLHSPVTISMICALVAVWVMAVVVMPILEAVARLLSQSSPAFGAGTWAIVDVLLMPLYAAVLVIWPLHYIRPRRKVVSLLARFVAATVIAFCTTHFLIFKQLSFAGVIVTTMAFIFGVIVIRVTDFVWASNALGDLSDGIPELVESDTESMEAPPAGQRSVGIALSGGGYRASLFALGALMYIREACRTPDTIRRVYAISSVSGGSITNGLLAHRGGLVELDDLRFEELARTLFQHTTGPGSMFFGARAKFYYFALLPLTFTSVVGLLWFGLPHVSFPTLARALAILGGFALLTLVISKADKHSRSSGPFYLLLAYPLLALAALFTPDWRTGMALIGAVLTGVGALVYVWSLRGTLIEKMIESLLQRTAGPTRLAEITSAIHHVFCTTEVQLSEPANLRREAIECPSLVDFAPNDLTMSRAIRASAAFPLAFPPVLIPKVAITESELSFDPREFVMPGARLTRLLFADGGVSDNLGVGWFEEHPHRMDELIMISAAPNRRRRHAISGIPGVSELGAILRISFLPYESRERLRRRGIVAALLSRPWTTNGLAAGAVVHIEDSPHDLAAIVLGRSRREKPMHEVTWEGFRGTLPDWLVDQLLAVNTLYQSAADHIDILAARALSALKHLEAVETNLSHGVAEKQPLDEMASFFGALNMINGYPEEAYRLTDLWSQRASRSAYISTTFAAIGKDDARNLVLHGYYLACTNLHVLLGWPLLHGLNQQRLDALDTS